MNTNACVDKPKLDNSGKPRSVYFDRLTAMTDEELRKACADFIWFSAYANNNPRSDFHWKCDACYDECKRRDKLEIYNEELAKLMRNT